MASSYLREDVFKANNIERLKLSRPLIIRVTGKIGPKSNRPQVKSSPVKSTSVKSTPGQINPSQIGPRLNRIICYI